MDFVNVLIGAVAGVVIAYVLFGKSVWPGGDAGVSQTGSDSGSDASDPDTEPPADSEVSQEGRTIYEISEDLGTAYHTCATPDDLAREPAFGEGVNLLRSGRFSADDLANYFCGDNAIVASLAARALRERPDGVEARNKIIQAIGTVAQWPMHFAAEYLAHSVAVSEPIIAKVLVRCMDVISNRQVQIALVEFIGQRLGRGEVPVFTDELDGAENYTLESLSDFISELEPDLRSPVESALQAWTDRHVDRRFLESFGTLWDRGEAPSSDDIVDYPELAEATDLVADTLLTSPARSLLLIGEPGTGKATLAKKVAERIAGDGWTIFNASHYQLMAGQSYLGQMEERVRQLLIQLGGRRRILWIVPNFHNLAYAGRHEHNPVSALDIVMGPIQRGDIRVLGITTPKAFEQLVRQAPAVETALAQVKLDPMPAEDSRALALEWLTRTTGQPDTGRALVQEAWDLADQYLTGQAAPGKLFELLRLTLHRVRSDAERTELMPVFDDLVTTLAEVTGLPIGLLDDNRRLDVDSLRRTFNARVLGQPEAVDCLVERVAMMKAGLADPRRPVGVFLFAGPTGTGKTEMAKTLAKWLFGSQDRMIRLDMSEFQTPDDLERIVGGRSGAEPDTLIGQIRKQPFSVILLDEFEKAHQRVWDLFLQVFDDGRLTDRAGFVAEFRHAIIILTSNLGGAVPTGPSLGFRTADEGFDTGSVMRAIEREFRREFINRLDRVVVFHPLSRDLMRKIVEKELADMLQRRGFRSKPWAVEWDAATIDFLLDRGFTRDLGARPLRRAIERHLLSPLALTIVAREAPAGDQFLLITRKGKELDVQFVDPDAPDDETDHPATDRQSDAAATLASIMASPAGSPAEMTVLRERYQKLAETAAGDPWLTSETDDMSAMNDPDFWKTERRGEVLDRIERRGRLKHALDRAASLLGRLDRNASGRRDRYPGRLMARLAGSLHLISIAMDDLIAGRPSDALIDVSVAAAHRSDANADAFVRELAGMYRNWAQSRRMRLEPLEADGPSSGFRAAVRGFGAYTILSREQGLHVLEGKPDKSKSPSRVVVEVRVLPETVDMGSLSGSALTREAERLFDAGTARLKIVRRYRRDPAPLVRDSLRGWKTDRLDRVLGGDFDIMG